MKNHQSASKYRRKSHHRKSPRHLEVGSDLQMLPSVHQSLQFSPGMLQQANEMSREVRIKQQQSQVQNSKQTFVEDDSQEDLVLTAVRELSRNQRAVDMSELTPSQQQLLYTQRDNMQNFLPSIYNSASMSKEPTISARYQETSPSNNNNDLFKNFIQPVFDLKDRSMFIDRKTYVDPIKKDMTEQTFQRQDSTDLTDHSLISHEGGKFTISNSQNLYDGKKKVNSSQKGNLLNIASELSPLLNKESTMEETLRHYASPVPCSIPSSEINDWINDGIKDASFRVPKPKRARNAAAINTTYNRNFKEKSMPRKVDNNSTQQTSPTNFYSSRNLMPDYRQAVKDSVDREVGAVTQNETGENRRYMSSDIFALKKIQAEQSRHELLMHVGSTTSRQNIHKRKERLLVQSLDLSQLVDSVKCMNRGSRFGRSPNMLKSHAVFKPQNVSAMMQEKHSSMAQIHDMNKKKKNFLIAPLKSPMHQPLGVADKGESMCETLIGQMPLGERQIQAETMKTFSPMKNLSVTRNKQSYEHTSTDMKNVHIHSRSSLPAETSSLSMQKPLQTTGNHMSDLGGINSTSNPSSPVLKQKGSAGLLHDVQLQARKPPNPLRLERILKADGNEDLGPQPIPFTRLNQLDDNESPLMFQGYSTMQLASSLSGNVSQSLLHNTSNQLQNNIMAADLAVNLENRVTTAAKRDFDESQFAVEATFAKVSQNDVTSELYSQFEMEVLRKKIEKRITMQKQTNQDDYMKRKMFLPDSESLKKGPFRLNMETQSRKTVMKILQDNRQKLSQTRQEIIDTLRIERHRQNTEALSTYNENASVTLSGTQAQAGEQTGQSIDTTSARKTAKFSKYHQTEDIVLQSVIFDRMTSGMPAIVPKGDMMSQMNQIKDEAASNGLHQRKFIKTTNMMNKEKLENVKFSTQKDDHPKKLTERFSGVKAKDESSPKQEQVKKPKDQTGQSWLAKDNAATGRLLQYQVDQIEQEALFREGDEEQLHGLLKYKISKYIKIQGADQPKISDMYRYEPKPTQISAGLEEETRQRKFHAAANKFMNMKKGRLMTTRSMQDLLTELERQEDIMVAAKQPMYGEISYDRAANEMFDVEPGIDIDSETHKKRKARALLFKYESDKAHAAAEQEELSTKVQNFVNRLLSDAHYSIESQYTYDADKSNEPKSAYFQPRLNSKLFQSVSPLLKVPQPSVMLLQKQNSVSSFGSPVKISRTERRSNLIAKARNNVRVMNNRPRKIDMGSIKKMSILRGTQKDKERFPLKYLTEDTTDDLNQNLTNQIAKKIFDLLDFYKVNKNSVSQVYLEKFAQDSRLGYLLECMAAMDPILPLLNKVLTDGTLFLKEYLMQSGQARGLAMACYMNPFLLQRVFIDNCGLSELDTATLMAGLTQLNMVRSLVLRRTTISEISIPHMGDLMLKIFPNNLNILKIEKCNISKEATFDLVSALKERNYVRVLSLVSVSFDTESIDVFCQLLEKKNFIEELDLSENRLEPKLFHLILEALTKCRSLKSICISWNLLIDKAKPPQIGTYCKEENIIYGRANQKIVFPPTPPNEKADPTEQVSGGEVIAEDQSQLLEEPGATQPPVSASLAQRVPLLPLDQMNSVKRDSVQMDGAPSRRSPALRQSSMLMTGMDIDQHMLRGTQMSKLEEDQKEEVNEQEEFVGSMLEELLQSSMLQHIDLSDCGLTEGIIIRLVKMIGESASILSAHLSGNPGIKEHVVSEIQDHLKATYEKPILKQTFKPLIRMYENKHGLTPTDYSRPQPYKVRDQMLEDIKEQEHSVSSASLFDYSQKNQVPQQADKLKDQLIYKNLKLEKEPLQPIDDAKLSRDHKRSFTISRQLGADLLTPGASEWQLQRDNAQECWVCDRKQFVFFFWSPEFATTTQFTASWLNQSDKDKIVEMVTQDRETSILREDHRLKVDDALKSPRNPFEIEEKEVSESIMSSDRELDSISEDSEGFDCSKKDQTRGSGWFDPTQTKKPKRRFFLEPMIYGQFNNWQPQPMLRVSHLARALDKRPTPDFLAQCKELNKCRPKINDITEMKPNEREFYQNHVSKFWESYEDPTVWGPIIAEFLKSKYKQTRIIGRENFEMLHPKKIYVTAGYMSMGKNNYLVTMGSQTYFHETKVSFRREQVPMQTKIRGDAVVKTREADVFKFWVKDTLDLVKKTYDLDFNINKIGQILKSPINQQELREFILPHYDFIKDIFLTLSLNSGNFPYLNSQEFTRFCKTIKILGGDLTQSRIDTIISYVKAKPKGMDVVKMYKQGGLDLSRAEFFEALVRLAIAKFKDMAPNPAAVSIQEAVEKLVLEQLRTNFVPAPWQVFRDEELWTQKPNLVFADNEDALRKLFKNYAKTGINKIPYAKAIELFTTDCSIKLDKFDAIYCYGMSLSTCTDLLKLTQNKLMHMGYEEFLEMIARAADVHFQGSEFEPNPLWEKIMLILDELFMLVEDCQSPVQPEWTTVIYNEAEFESNSVKLFKRPNVR